jgi:hypothetical protein
MSKLSYKKAMPEPGAEPAENFVEKFFQKYRKCWCLVRRLTYLRIFNTCHADIFHP